MKRIPIRYSSDRANIMTRIASLIVAIVGFVISFPFFIIVMILGYNFHYITFPIFLMLMGLVIGAPMFWFGVISLLRGSHPAEYGSTSELDIGRIRYTVETDKNRR